MSSSATQTSNSSETDTKETLDLGNGSEVVYYPRFLPQNQSYQWLEYLDKKIPWTRPEIHVFGRSCLQPRDTCYVANKGLQELEYSGYQPLAYSWDDFPPLKAILELIHETLPGSKFNSLLLNRYKIGTDYVSWHSDDEKLYGPTPEIASISFGCEREFLLRKREKTPKLSMATSTKYNTSSEQSKASRLEQRSFVLKHGSMLVMRGYVQRDWVHSIPKRAKANTVRINLTFRQVLN
ncbi:Alkylated DNA repair protein [Zostera marina]|uniref:Alkylated DNA repair protein n=1 Tax=Zostera marina TaxID=29655 RepID=A0A0K9NM18_ZOSMR|nr:Alkylated DNA repair protein [Zostera marina]